MESLSGRSQRRKAVSSSSLDMTWLKHQLKTAWASDPVAIKHADGKSGGTFPLPPRITEKSSRVKQLEIKSWKMLELNGQHLSEIYPFSNVYEPQVERFTVAHFYVEIQPLSFPALSLGCIPCFDFLRWLRPILVLFLILL